MNSKKRKYVNFVKNQNEKLKIINEGEKQLWDDNLKDLLITRIPNEIILKFIIPQLKLDQSIFQWTKFKMINRIWNEFIERMFPKPKYLSLRIIKDPMNGWKLWLNFHGASETRRLIIDLDVLDYFFKNKGKTIEKQLPICFLFISPLPFHLTKKDTLRCDSVDFFTRIVEKKLALNFEETNKRLVKLSKFELDNQTMLKYWLGKSCNFKKQRMIPPIPDLNMSHFLSPFLDQFLGITNDFSSIIKTKKN